MRDTSWASGISPELGKEWLLRFTGRTITVDSAVQVMKNRPDFVNTSLRHAPMRQALEKVADQLVFEVKATELEGQSPEFAALMKEYSEGILLYQVEQERVWNRITVTDSSLQGYFGAHREDFRYPDRVDIDVLRVANDSIGTEMRTRLQGGTRMADLVREDSVRMKRRSVYEIVFQKKKATLPKNANALLTEFVEELAVDPALRITATAYHDSAGPKGASEKLAVARLKSVRDQLVKKLHADDKRVGTQSKIPPRTTPDTTLARLGRIVNVELGGRRPHISGGVENFLLPVTADERTVRADSLAPGSYTEPFLYETAVQIVRLNRREPSRLKTFEEAGTEVSSAFQEYESKRLEREWLERLRTQYPVTTTPALLQEAFVPAAK
jgi:peptidyl-prolyl cis-trans isomerase SurA